MMTKRLFLAPLALAAVAAAPGGAPLTVTLDGFRQIVGQARVMVCREPEWLKPDCAYSRTVPVAARTMTIAIPGVAPGVYGITAYHDRNSNGKADRNLIGLPTELIGFSNDAPASFGPPTFADARFTHGIAAQSIALKMRKLP